MFHPPGFNLQVQRVRGLVLAPALKTQMGNHFLRLFTAFKTCQRQEWPVAMQTCSAWNDCWLASRDPLKALSCITLADSPCTGTLCSTQGCIPHSHLSCCSHVANKAPSGPQIPLHCLFSPFLNSLGRQDLPPHYNNVTIFYSSALWCQCWKVLALPKNRGHQWVSISESGLKH